MIISASRRTDIPAFYAKWFIKRVRAGYCAVPNPFNLKQVSFVSLAPEDVDCIVFWTRNPTPLFPYLKEIAERGLGFYVLFTLVNNPQEIDPHSPSLAAAVDAFQRLSDTVGPDRVIWRYDPIVLSTLTPIEYHLTKFTKITELLAGYTQKAVFSFVENYRKTRRRFDVLERNGVHMTSVASLNFTEIEPLVSQMADVADQHGIELQSCAGRFAFASCNVQPARCIDNVLINKLFQGAVSRRKDPSQRKECGCVQSRDIGMYDSCLFGCSYCYATRSFDLVRQNYQQHDPESPSLLGRYDAIDPIKQREKANRPAAPKQQRLF